MSADVENASATSESTAPSTTDVQGEPATSVDAAAPNLPKPSVQDASPTAIDAPPQAIDAPPQASDVAAAPIGPAAIDPRPDIPPTLGVVRAVIVAALIQIATNAILIASTLPMNKQGARLRGLHHLYDAGQHLAAGLFAAALVAVWVRWGPQRPLWGKITLVLAAWMLAIPILKPDLAPFVNRVTPIRWAPMALILLTGVTSLVVAVAAEVGQRLGRTRKLAWIGGFVGLGTLIANHRLLRHSYTGVHFYAAWTGAVLIAASIASMRQPRWWGRLIATLPWIMAILISGFTIVVWPGNTVLVEVLKMDGSVVAPWIARLHVARRSHATIPPAARSWFVNRSAATPIPPSSPSLLPKDGVVILITVDSLRADVVTSESHDAVLPTLAALRKQSINFTMARANGSQTVYSLSSLFFGTYFSQQYWVPHPKHPHLFPQADPTIRFPKFLGDAGISTVNVASSFFLGNEFGLLGGFAEEIYTKDKETFAHAANVINDVITRLERHRGGPLFLYCHLLDAHAPYNRGNGRGSEFQKYLGALSYIDSQIGRLVKTLETTTLATRTALIVSADHGEAFGEHGVMSQHSLNLYDEQIRIPLLVRMPSISPRKVTTPVTLMDLGPTVLDLMGVSTPGWHMGQSLVPFFRGQNPVLNRPVIIEGRLKKALVMNDDYKVIIDDHAHTTELYDLRADPTELRNLYDDPTSLGGDRIELLRTFFDVHTIRRPGYVVPYRP